jgi:predicted HTH transcriptional regulator
MARARAKPEEAVRESTRVEFKEQLDPADGGEWCEVIKDIVAMANSGGGSIVLGVKDDGTPSGWNPSQLLSVDPAKIVDKIARYTGQQFSDFTVYESQRAGKRVAVMEVQAMAVPMVFVRPGTYDIGNGKQKTAFGAGALYFRHGSKSEPAASEDLKACVQREVDRARKELLGNMRKLAYLPVGYQLKALPAKLASSSDPGATGMRLVDDPAAPASIQTKHIPIDQRRPWPR